MQPILRSIHKRGGVLIVSSALLGLGALFSLATEPNENTALKSALGGIGFAVIGAITAIRRRGTDGSEIYSLAPPRELLRDSVILPAVLAGGAYLVAEVGGNTAVAGEQARPAYSAGVEESAPEAPRREFQ